MPWEAEVAGGYAPPFYEDPSLEKHRKDLGHGFKWAEPPQSVVVGGEWHATIARKKTHENGGVIMFDEATGRWVGGV